MRPWQALQVGVVAMFLEARTHGGHLLAVLDGEIRDHIRRRRCGRGAHDAVEHPRAAQHRRGAVARRKCAAGRRPCPAGRSGSRCPASRGGTVGRRRRWMPYCRASASLRKVQSALSRSITLRSSSSTLDRNMRISVSKLPRIAALNCRRSGRPCPVRPGSARPARSSRPACWRADPSACARPAPSSPPDRTASSLSPGSSSCSSGPVFHRKNDRREASSRSVSRRRDSFAFAVRSRWRDTGSPGSRAPP